MKNFTRKFTFLIQKITSDIKKFQLLFATPVGDPFI